MKKVTIFIGVLLSLVIAGCGSDSINDSIDPKVSSPTTISGKSIKSTVHSGSGGFTSNGRWTFVSYSTDNKYKVLGDGIYTVNTRGTFSYSGNNNKGTIAFDDSILGKGNFTLTFTSETSGTYTAEAGQGSLTKQTGSFEIIN